MKFLLTSAGIKNISIHEALVGLLGKPFAESTALCIPTALYGHPMAGPGNAWRFISGQEPEDFQTVLGQLNPAQRSWLKRALEVYRPRDPWLHDLEQSMQC